MTNDKPRLIEVAFPLKQASLASVHEKNVRHGHISTLHIWPARRPLAACRAALLATLLPDPGDPVQRAELLEKIGGKVSFKYVTEADDAGREVAEKKEVLEGGILAWGNESADAMDDFRTTIREEYPDGPRVLDPFAGGGAIPLEAMRLGCRVTASDLNPVAWFVLKCTLDYPQRFAGKKWPLPEFAREWPDFVEDFLSGKVKKRRGSKRVNLSDPHQPQLDPAKISPNAEATSEKTSACFGGTLNDATLAWHVRAWGRWVLERARTELAPRYPQHNGEPTVAYLHARTARDRITLARIPLLKTFWLCKKAGRRVALLPVPLADRSGVQFRLLDERALANPVRVVEENPQLAAWEVTAETLMAFLASGTMNRSGVWCPASGRPGLIALTTKNDLPRQGQQGLLGTQMTAVVVEAREGNLTRKRYRLPTETEVSALAVEQEELDDVYRDIPFGIPEEPTPAGGGSGASRAFSLHRYGITRWRDVFIPRQLLALGVFVKQTRHAIVELQKLYPDQPEIAEAVGAYLTVTFGRFLNYMSTQCLWASAADEIKQTFSRYAFPITWDFAEASPLTESDRFYQGGLEVGVKALESLLEATMNEEAPKLNCESSINAVHVGHDVVFTDPPYYDAIPYSDLMDFFFVWQKRILVGFGGEVSRVFTRELTPKWDSVAEDGELIDDESRHGGDRAKSKKSYEEGMARSFGRACDSLSATGRFVIVFANKDVDAWETLVGAMIKAGCVVTASWPIQTEMPGGFRNFNRASLASSIWIVCRKRLANAGSGWDKTVLDRMREILFEPRETLGARNILQYYFDLGIRGPDFLWAALGPALEAYSAHSFVKRQAGGTMSVDEFLQQVRRLVLQFSLGELPGFREVTRDTSGRGESLDLDPVTQYYLLHRAFFGLEPAPSGACILYANGCGLNETALRLVWQVLEQGGTRVRASTGEDVVDTDEDDSKGQYRLVDWRARAQRDGLGESRAGQPAPLIDRLHRLTFLLSANRAAEVQESYENWGLAAEPAFLPLIQALHSLADRERHAEEKKLIEALAAQLKLNRRTVVEDGKVSEVPTLAGWGADFGRPTDTISNAKETE